MSQSGIKEVLSQKGELIKLFFLVFQRFFFSQQTIIFALILLIRLQKELMALMTSSEKSVSAFPEDSNFFRWKVIDKIA